MRRSSFSWIYRLIARLLDLLAWLRAGRPSHTHDPIWTGHVFGRPPRTMYVCRVCKRRGSEPDGTTGIVWGEA